MEEATVTITADDQYELYVTGRRVGQGASIRQMEKYDITRLLGRGRNVIAVQATHVAQSAAAWGGHRMAIIHYKSSCELSYDFADSEGMAVALVNLGNLSF